MRLLHASTTAPARVPKLTTHFLVCLKQTVKPKTKETTEEASPHHLHLLLRAVRCSKTTVGIRISSVVPHIVLQFCGRRSVTLSIHGRHPITTAGPSGQGCIAFSASLHGGLRKNNLRGRGSAQGHAYLDQWIAGYNTSRYRTLYVSSHFRGGGVMQGNAVKTRGYAQSPSRHEIVKERVIYQPDAANVHTSDSY